MEQSLENEKNQLQTHIIGYRYCKMKVKLITLVSDLKYTTWRSLVNIFEHVYSFILRDYMTEQSKTDEK